MTDETRAPGGSAGRRRRPGGAKHRGTMVRFAPDVAAALEADARETGQSKVMILEGMLRRRYRLPARSRAAA